jgi:hypothetical protein
MSRVGQEERVQARSPQSRSRWRDVRRGLRQRNPLVLVAAAALVVVALLAVQEATLHGAFTVVPQGRLLRIANDDYMHISYRLAELKKHPPAVPAIYLFGGSGAMESIVGERSLQAAVERRSGEQVDVVSLAAHQQSLAQNLAIVDNLPRGPALLLVGLAPMRFTVAPDADANLLAGRPLLLRSPRLEQLAPKLFGRAPPLGGALPGIFDYTGSYLRARAAGGVFWGVRIPYAYHYYPAGAKGASPLAKRRNVGTVLARDRALYALYADYNFVVLAELVRLARERGYVIAFYDQPLNASAAGPDWAGVAPAYRARAEAMARREGVAYLNVDRHVRLRDADFADLYHLLDSGRAKWQPEIARRLADLLPALGGGQTSREPSTATSAAP